MEKIPSPHFHKLKKIFFEREGRPLCLSDSVIWKGEGYTYHKNSDSGYSHKLCERTYFKRALLTENNFLIYRVCSLLLVIWVTGRNIFFV